MKKQYSLYPISLSILLQITIVNSSKISWSENFNENDTDTTSIGKLSLFLFCNDENHMCGKYNSGIEENMNNSEFYDFFMRNQINLVYVDTLKIMNHLFVKSNYIKNVPTFKLAYNNKRSYTQKIEENWEENSAINLLKYLQKKIVHGSKPIKSESELENYRSKEKDQVFYTGERTKYLEIFKKIAASYSDITFIHSYSKPLANPDGITVYYYKRFDTSGHFIMAPWTFDSLENFIGRHRNYQLIYNDYVKNRIFDIDRKAMILFTENSLNESTDIFRKTCNDFLTEEILCLSLNLTKNKEIQMLYANLGISNRKLQNKLDAFLTIVDVNSNGLLNKYAFEGNGVDFYEIDSTEAITTFYEKYKSGILKNYYLSENTQENDSRYILTLNSEKLSEHYNPKIRERGDVIIFYGPHCQEETEKLYKVIELVYKEIDSQAWLGFKFFKQNTMWNEGPDIPSRFIKKPEIWVNNRFFEDDLNDVQGIMNFVLDANYVRTWRIQPKNETRYIKKKVEQKDHEENDL